jgi:hypothetical protein
MLVERTVYRTARLLGAFLLVAAIWLGIRYATTHAGWDFGEGSDDLMTIMLLTLGSVLSLSIAFFHPGPGNPAGSRRTSVAWSIALLIALLLTWRTIILSTRWIANVGTTIDSPAALDAFIAAHPDTFAPYTYRVPTGVYLQSFEFLSSSDVEISGYVWQKYGPEIPDSVLRGIVLPEELEDAYNPVKAWQVERNGVEEIGWYFSGTFRQHFDYRHYPFDQQGVWVRLWHPEPLAGVLLVPDFAAYGDLTPRALPGVDTRFVYGGWDPVSSRFSYDLVPYNVDFGLGYGVTGVPDPELYFSLDVERDFLSPMLEHLVLEGVIAVLLFLLLILIVDDSRIRERVGLRVFDLIVAAGGLLFAVILDHNAIRNAVQSQELTYLEWFPLTLDVFIVLVVLSAVLKSRHWRAPLVGYTGDLVPVLAYWPALLGTLLLLTVRTFFYS